MLDVGDSAPEFELPNQDGDSVTRSEFDDWLVVYFYPRANTEGCTTEACQFDATLPSFANAGADVVAISDDPVADLADFASEYDLEFDLLSDVDGEVSTLYDSYGEKRMFGNTFDGVFRNTYVVDPDGQIAATYESVNPDSHAQAVLTDLEQLASTQSRV